MFKNASNNGMMWLALSASVGLTQMNLINNEQAYCKRNSFIKQISVPNQVDKESSTQHSNQSKNFGDKSLNKSGGKDHVTFEDNLEDS